MIGNKDRARTLIKMVEEREYQIEVLRGEIKTLKAQVVKLQTM